ncbi:M14 family metallopeptidase [Aliamphritea hakodatensis]|uniref:M14 family metallopeptidase n=1 Tax=Aliamphritea hakodatensis TaxID=2895352 RepID=UPI00300DF958
MLTVSCAFDAGNIEVVDQRNPADIQLNIRKDHQSDFFQWFFYRVQGAAGQQLRMRLLNADQAAYVDGWEDYQAVASYDREHWFRVPTRYENGELVIEHQPETNSLYYAYFAPYSYERHLDLLAWAEQHSNCRSVRLGQTLDGRDLDLLVVGNPAVAKAAVWVTARQHPGETMAEWLVEGFLERLFDNDDAQARRLSQQLVFFVVPNMNPDGSVRGHLRTNAAGVNLNREWMTPSMEQSPEVYLVRQQMAQTGVDLHLDIHGDEALPCNFIAGQEGIPDTSAAILAAEQRFQEVLMTANPDFQMERGYEPGVFGEETLTMCSNWVGQHHNCPAMTLEMPFKDYDLQPDPVQGWSAGRSAKLGASLLDPIADWLQNRDRTESGDAC